MSIESKLEKLRGEVAKRTEEAGRLRAKAARQFSEGDADPSVDTETRAAALERAVGLLQEEQRRLAATLQAERVQAALAEVDGRREKARVALREEAERALAAWRKFFEAWNALVSTRIGQRSAAQLLGDFHQRLVSAAKVSPKAVEIGLQIEEQAVEAAANVQRAEVSRTQGEAFQEETA